MQRHKGADLLHVDQALDSLQGLVNPPQALASLRQGSASPAQVSGSQKGLVSPRVLVNPQALVNPQGLARPQGLASHQALAKPRPQASVPHPQVWISFMSSA